MTRNFTLRMMSAGILCVALSACASKAGKMNKSGLENYKENNAMAAEQDFRAAIDREPEYAAAHNNLGLALSRQGKNTEAITHYDHAIQLENDNPEFWHNR